MGVTHKFFSGEGSQEDVGWLLNGQVKASLGLCSQELFDFFLAYKCPQEFWDTLRSKVFVERYADTSDFANRVWNDLPMIIYWHIDHDKSIATDELDHMFLDSDDENDSESSPEETSGTKD